MNYSIVIRRILASAGVGTGFLFVVTGWVWAPDALAIGGVIALARPVTNCPADETLLGALVSTLVGGVATPGSPALTPIISDMVTKGTISSASMNSLNYGNAGCLPVGTSLSVATFMFQSVTNVMFAAQRTPAASGVGTAPSYSNGILIVGKLPNAPYTVALSLTTQDPLQLTSLNQCAAAANLARGIGSKYTFYAYLSSGLGSGSQLTVSAKGPAVLSKVFGEDLTSLGDVRFVSGDPTDATIDQGLVLQCGDLINQ